MTNIIKKVKNWVNASPSPSIKNKEWEDKDGDKWRLDGLGRLEWWNEDEGRWCSLSPSVSPSEEPTASVTESDSISPSPSDDPPSPSPSPSPEPHYTYGESWKCSSCGQRNRYDVLVCQYCGAPQ